MSNLISILQYSLHLPLKKGKMLDKHKITLCGFSVMKFTLEGSETVGIIKYI